MKTSMLLAVLWGVFIVMPAQAQNNAVSVLLHEYASQGAVMADAERGKKLWQKTYIGKGEFLNRSCTQCHSNDLTKMGRHVKTHKSIKPMSAMINADRLTKIKKIKKWFKRNCKWTMARECSAQEKSDILVYINQQRKF